MFESTTDNNIFLTIRINRLYYKSAPICPEHRIEQITQEGDPMRISIKCSIISALLTMLLTFSPAISQVNVSPLGIAVDLEAGDTLETSINITNEYDEAVECAIYLSELNLDEDRDQAARPGDNDNYQLIPPYRDDRGGPDEMEYEWRDDQEDDGPIYNWIDIIDFDDVVDIEPLTDDYLCGDEVFELGFEFPFYGNEFAELAIYPNGYACMQGNNNIEFFYPWPVLPSDSTNPPPPPNLFLVAYQDLNPDSGGHVYFWTDERMAVVTWQDVPHYFQYDEEEEDLWTFQLVLYANGFVKFQYAEIGMYRDVAGLSIMIGLQNNDRDLGFIFMDRNDEDYLENERVIGIGQPDTWISWVKFDPQAGEIDAESDLEVEVVFISTDPEAGVYAAEAHVLFNDQAETHVSFPLVMSVDLEVGGIAGTITDAADDAVIADAGVRLVPFDFRRITDENGRFAIDNLPPGIYSLSCYVQDYQLFVIEEIEVVEGEMSDGSMGMLHAECAFEPDSVQSVLSSGESEQIDVTCTNGGNGPLTYSISKRLPGGADAAPWENRLSYNLGELLDDSRIEGVVFADNRFYISAGENDPNVIYVLDADGALIDTFDQPSETRYGIYDLAWDGELLWVEITAGISSDSRPMEKSNTIGMDLSELTKPLPGTATGNCCG